MLTTHGPGCHRTQLHACADDTHIHGLGNPEIVTRLGAAAPVEQRVIQIASGMGRRRTERLAVHRGPGEGLHATFGLSVMSGGTLHLSSVCCLGIAWVEFHNSRLVWKIFGGS